MALIRSVNMNGTQTCDIKMNTNDLTEMWFNGVQVYPCWDTPTTITNFSASDSYCNKITVWFSAASGTPTPTHDLYEGGTLIASNISNGYEWATTRRNVTLHVKAINGPGDGIVSSNTNSGSAYYLNAPTNFSASDSDTSIAGKIKFTWTNASGYPTPTYDIYEWGTRIATNVSSGWIKDYGAAHSATYYVRAVNSCGYKQSAGNTGTSTSVGPIGWTNDSLTYNLDDSYGLQVSGLNIRVGTSAGSYGSWVGYVNGVGFGSVLSHCAYGFIGEQYLGFGAGAYSGSGTSKYQFKQYSAYPGNGWGTGVVEYNPTTMTWSGSSLVYDNEQCYNSFETSGGSIRWKEICLSGSDDSGAWTRLE